MLKFGRRYLRPCWQWTNSRKSVEGKIAVVAWTLSLCPVPRRSHEEENGAFVNNCASEEGKSAYIGASLAKKESSFHFLWRELGAFHILQRRDKNTKA